MARATALPNARPAIWHARCPGTWGSAGCGTSYRRWPDGHSGRTDRDVRPVPWCGNERWHRAPCDAAMQGAIRTSPRSCCPLRGRCRPPRGWAGSSLPEPPVSVALGRSCNRERVERVGDRIHMPPGEVQIDAGVIDRSMAEQYLDGAQVCTCFMQVSRVAVAQSVRRNVLLDPGSSRCPLAGKPDRLVTDRHIGSPAIDHTRKEEGLRLHPSPVTAQLFQQRRAKRHIPVAPALAQVDMNHHALAVDVCGLQLA